MDNFAFPYFSRDIAEFSRRWHISRSTWFRDYLYIPLGGSRGGTWMKVRNTFIIFIVSGLWHGANWTFLVRGTLNAIYFLPLLLLGKNRSNIEVIAKDKWFGSLKDYFGMFITFVLTVFAWKFFRAESVTHALNIIAEIFSVTLFEITSFGNQFNIQITILFVLIFLIIEWFGRDEEFALSKLNLRVGNKILRYITYYGVTISIFWFGGQQQEFIYFQF